MSRNHNTFITLLTGALILLSVISPLRAQPGGRTAAPPKKTMPAKRNTPAPRQSTCSAQSPTRASGRVYTLTLRDGVKMELVEIPAGNFCMGSTSGKADELPVRHVSINYSFYIGKYEVTQAQWQAVMGNNPSHFKDCGNCPVEQVSWDDAQGFIRRLNQMNNGFIYRLPTEAEWEYSCRAGTTGDYSGYYKKMAWYEGNSQRATHVVGSMWPNNWGLFDMHGNVSEWCEDWYHETYYGAPSDGSAWLSGADQESRILRGGSWYSLAFYLRSAYRHANSLDVRHSFNGFRIVARARAQ